MTERIQERELEYLDTVIARSKQTRRTWFGQQKTNAAEAAEIVLACYVPRLVNEIRQLRGSCGEEMTGETK